MSGVNLVGCFLGSSLLKGTNFLWMGTPQKRSTTNPRDWSVPTRQPKNPKKTWQLVFVTFGWEKHLFFFLPELWCYKPRIMVLQVLGLCISNPENLKGGCTRLLRVVFFEETTQTSTMNPQVHMVVYHVCSFICIDVYICKYMWYIYIYESPQWNMGANLFSV